MAPSSWQKQLVGSSSICKRNRTLCGISSWALFANGQIFLPRNADVSCRIEDQYRQFLKNLDSVPKVGGNFWRFWFCPYNLPMYRSRKGWRNCSWKAKKNLMSSIWLTDTGNCGHLFTKTKSCREETIYTYTWSWEFCFCRKMIWRITFSVDYLLVFESVKLTRYLHGANVLCFYYEYKIHPKFGNCRLAGNTFMAVVHYIYIFFHWEEKNSCASWIERRFLVQILFTPNLSDKKVSPFTIGRVAETLIPAGRHWKWCNM